MIISASRRTDIPAFFSEWIINRLKEQYAYVRNPMNIHQVSKINLSPDVVDCIVFWSKNPKPIINKLNALKDYMYYFQFTLNAYDKDFEENLPTLSTRIDTFQTLSNYIGKERVIWRYDPIIINEKYSIDWHIERFKYLTEQLCLYTEKVTISFIDLYTKISHNIKGKNIYDVLNMTVEEAVDFFENVPSIRRKMETLRDVGLSYIRLGQPSTELSGGEAQRIKLATELSKRSTGKTVYILDEPTTGLHFADVHKLVDILARLTEGGNTVIVIEHNLEVIKTADYIIDMGPEGGSGGGTVVAAGTPEEICEVEESYTGQYLKGILNR